MVMTADLYACNYVVGDITCELKRPPTKAKCPKYEGDKEQEVKSSVNSSKFKRMDAWSKMLTADMFTCGNGTRNRPNLRANTNTDDGSRR